METRILLPQAELPTQWYNIQADLNRPLDPLRPRLTFQVQIPESGRYVVWSQVKIDGQERFAPFWIEVGP